jgi:sec-independent protein translocase protein TatA
MGMMTTQLAAFTGTEIMWIALVILVLFGARKVPDLMRGVGQGIKEFKSATREEDGDSKPTERK